MVDLTQAIRDYAGYSAAQKAQFLNSLNDQIRCVEKLYTQLEHPQDARAVLRILADAAKKERIGKALHFLEISKGYARAFLQSDDAKQRKNAAILIGACCAGVYAQALTEALKRENTEFVRPSIILALGKTGSREVYDFLKAYTVKSEVAKHRDEESLALLKALSALNSESLPLKIPDISGFSILLTCPPGHADLTMEELDENERDYKSFPLLPDTLLVKAGSYEELFSCRTFYEALIYLGKCGNTERGLVDFLKNPKFRESMEKLYGTGEVRYRIEVRGNGVSHEQRKAYIEAAARAVACPGLVNSPSNYSFELRLAAEKEQIILLVKPAQDLDKRFAYRLHTLPASINPVTAAAINRYIYPYLKRDADVLDPFCGSGTLLFERAKAKPCRTLTGTDNQKYAVAAAMQNETAAKTGARFYHTDILDFNPKRQYTEVLSNMPFGHRVGSHEGNEALYRGFVKKLYTLLKPGGMAFLYTNDKKLLTDILIKQEGFLIVDETVFSSGNLHPSLFILLKND